MSYPMPQAGGPEWQYCVINGRSLNAQDLDRQCNGLGAQGWELVAVIPVSRHLFSDSSNTSGVRLFFKRRIR